MTLFDEFKIARLLLVLLLTLPLLSCEEKRKAFLNEFFFLSLVPGEIFFTEIRQNTDVSIPQGTVTFRGRFQNLLGVPPDELDLLIEHRSKNGKNVLESWKVDLLVTSDGKIPRMSMTFPGTVLPAGDRLRFNWSVQGRPFIGGNLVLKANYKAKPF